ncbi:hypothetical protein RIF23_10490 [Lipingzhangella sp. LS1_29]|uniref:Uncharacterized protein n=1 Tax=Lipingzhangella rawalii TaxID=2055835 RepID=A0ABU2H606_9ACTN|nr:hypothetical protein [Lipingzhangella rawalii]MDS1270727.1 hypothetical protein [Lipingzhangella rawalii]
MTLRYLGKDPESPEGRSPTLYYDDERDTYVFQSWRVTDAERLAVLDLPEHETVIEFPRRMMRFFPEINSDATEVDGPRTP